MTEPIIEIVELTPVHADALAPQIADADPWQRLGINQSSIIKMLTSKAPDHIQRAILLDTKPVGAIVVHLDWLLGPYLRHLSILESARGRGAGARAIEWLVQLATDQSQRNIWLCVSEFNTGAQRFYTRHGFNQAARLNDLVSHGEHEILMRRELDQTI